MVHQLDDHGRLYTPSEHQVFAVRCPQLSCVAELQNSCKGQQFCCLKVTTGEQNASSIFYIIINSNYSYCTVIDSG